MKLNKVVVWGQKVEARTQADMRPAAHKDKKAKFKTLSSEIAGKHNTPGEGQGQKIRKQELI